MNGLLSLLYHDVYADSPGESGFEAQRRSATSCRSWISKASSGGSTACSTIRRCG